MTQRYNPAALTSVLLPQGFVTRQRIKDGLNCTMMANDLGFSHMILEYITNTRVLDAFWV